MALPTSEELLTTGTYFFRGEPFVEITLDPTTDAFFRGEPFVSVPAYETPTYSVAFTQAFLSATVNATEVVSIPVLSLTQTNNDPNVQIFSLVTCDTLVFTQSTNAPKINESVIPTKITFTQTTYNPNIKADERIVPFPLIDQIHLQVPTIREDLRVLVDTKTFTQTTQAVNVNAVEVIDCPSLSFTQTGQNAAVNSGTQVDIAQPVEFSMTTLLMGIPDILKALVAAMTLATLPAVVNAAEVVSVDSPLSGTQITQDVDVNSRSIVQPDYLQMSLTTLDPTVNGKEIVDTSSVSYTQTTSDATINGREVVALNDFFSWIQFPIAGVHDDWVNVNARTNLSVDTGTFTQTTLDPAVLDPIVPSGLQFTMSTFETGVSGADNVLIGTITNTQTLFAPAINEEFIVDADGCSFAETLNSVTINAGYVAEVDTHVFTQSTFEPAVTGTDNVPVGSISNTQALFAPTINEEFVVDADAQPFTQTLNSATINASYAEQVGTKGFTQSFGSVIVPEAQFIEIDQRSFVQSFLSCQINEQTRVSVPSKLEYTSYLTPPSLITISGIYTTDWKQPNAGRTVGTPAWQTPGNVLAFDNTYVTNTTLGTLASTAVAYDFRLGLPSTARVTSYEGSYEAKRTITGTSLTLTMGMHTTKDGGTTPSTNKLTSTWTTTESVFASSDFGDTNYSVAEFNSSDFGIVFKQVGWTATSVTAVTRSIDSVKVRVSYRVPVEIILVNDVVRSTQNLYAPYVTDQTLVYAPVSYSQTAYDVEVVADDNVSVDLYEFTHVPLDAEVGYIQWVRAPFSQLRLTAHQPMIETIYMVDNSGNLTLSGDDVNVMSATTMKPESSLLMFITPRVMINRQRET